MCRMTDREREDFNLLRALIDGPRYLEEASNRSRVYLKNCGSFGPTKKKPAEAFSLDGLAWSMFCD
jgi:hypothetical protein